MNTSLTEDDDSPSVIGPAAPMPTAEEFRAAHKSEYVRLFVEVGVDAETAGGWHERVMSAPLSAEKRGEGFAFFRWHSMRWPRSGSCRYAMTDVCRHLWASRIFR